MARVTLGHYFSMDDSSHGSAEMHMIHGFRGETQEPGEYHNNCQKADVIWEADPGCQQAHLPSIKIVCTTECTAECSTLCKPLDTTSPTPVCTWKSPHGQQHLLVRYWDGIAAVRTNGNTGTSLYARGWGRVGESTETGSDDMAADVPGSDHTAERTNTCKFSYSIKHARGARSQKGHTCAFNWKLSGALGRSTRQHTVCVWSS